MSKEKVDYSDVETNYLVEALQDVALEKYDFSNTPKIDGLTKTLKTLSKNIYFGEENLPISEKQVSILNTTIEYLVPLIRKGYLILYNRYQKRDSDNLTLGSIFPISFKVAHNYHAHPNLLSIFDENNVWRHDDNTYLKVRGIGVRGTIDISDYLPISGDGEQIISKSEFCISLENMDDDLYLVTDRDVVVKGIPLFKKTVSFNRVDRLSNELINKMMADDYKQAMKWVFNSLISVLLAVKDTNKHLFFVEDSSIHRNKISFH